MHVPDGYLSPVTMGAFYAASVPFWGIAAQRTKKALSGRVVPLLSIFAAFTFAIMMFNVPVPGGTTAHAVGGTLTAIVLGPWASVISTSVALIIQALFFGDGGITAIGVNCFNMAVVLPVVGYWVYRLLSGRTPVLSQRRVLAAAVGAYAGITVASLLVGLELGIQPHIWSTDGIPDYSPYGLETSIPAMLVAHMLGASFVEAAVTALAVAYIQKTFPDILLRREPGDGAPQRSGGDPLVTAGVLTGAAAAVIFVAGLIRAEGHLDEWAGLDWSNVDWTAAGQTILVSAVVSALVLPLVFVLFRHSRGARAAVLIFAALVIWAPIGLIAPGGAFGEDSTATQEEVDTALAARASGDDSLFEALPDVNKECQCVPNNIDDVGFSGHTPLGGYEPPWVSEDDAAWRQNVGYQVAGISGIALFALLGAALWEFAKWLAPQAPPDWRNA